MNTETKIKKAPAHRPRKGKNLRVGFSISGDKSTVEQLDSWLAEMQARIPGASKGDLLDSIVRFAKANTYSPAKDL